MRVLGLGATGFIGARLAAALAAAGCDVVRGERNAAAGRPDAVVIDFAQDRRPEDWLELPDEARAVSPRGMALARPAATNPSKGELHGDSQASVRTRRFRRGF